MDETMDPSASESSLLWRAFVEVSRKDGEDDDPFVDYETFPRLLEKLREAGFPIDVSSNLGHQVKLTWKDFATAILLPPQDSSMSMPLLVFQVTNSYYDPQANETDEPPLCPSEGEAVVSHPTSQERGDRTETVDPVIADVSQSQLFKVSFMKLLSLLKSPNLAPLAAVKRVWIDGRGAAFLSFCSVQQLNSRGSLFVRS